MEDWLKILISGFVGFVGGLAAEPLKAFIKDEIDGRRAARLLAEEIGMLAAQGKVLWSLYEYVSANKGCDVGMFQFRYERFPYFSNGQKSILLRIKGYEHVRTFYDWISRADGKNLRIEVAGNILFQFAALRHHIDSGELAKPFTKLLSTNEFMDVADNVAAFRSASCPPLPSQSY